MSNRRRRQKVALHLKEENGHETGTDEGQEVATDGGTSTSVWAWVGWGGAVAGSWGWARSLDLTIGNLAGGGNGCLDLAVCDLRSGASWGLNLTVGDLAGGVGWGLNLTIGDLRGSWGGSDGLLDLTVGKLGCHWGLDLAVGDLRGTGSTSWLAVTLLTSATVARGWGASARAGDDNVDIVALRSVVLEVDVVEVARQAVAEDGVGANGNGAVGADGPTGVVLGAGLTVLGVELELFVGNNAADTVLGVTEDTVLDGEGTALAGEEITLAALGDVDGAEDEVAVVGGLAACWGGLWRSEVGGARSAVLGSGSSQGREGERCKGGTHLDG